jgi:hypothetical protein
MADQQPSQLAIDIPMGVIARVQIKPVDENGKVAKLDGPVEATVISTDPNTAEVVVGGKDGLFVDVKLPDAEGSIATIELDGDNDQSPDTREVITSILAVRRIGDLPGKAVTLGVAVEGVSFPTADQFGVFPDATPPASPRRK